MGFEGDKKPSASRIVAKTVVTAVISYAVGQLVFEIKGRSDNMEAAKESLRTHFLGRTSLDSVNDQGDNIPAIGAVDPEEIK